MSSTMRSSLPAKPTAAAKGYASGASRPDAPIGGLRQPELNRYTIQRYKRFWEVRAPSGELVCLTVYKRGAEEVIRRLQYG